jgi:hypothetical protein
MWQENSTGKFRGADLKISGGKFRGSALKIQGVKQGKTKKVFRCKSLETNGLNGIPRDP